VAVCMLAFRVFEETAGAHVVGFVFLLKVCGVDE